MLSTIRCCFVPVFSVHLLVSCRAEGCLPCSAYPLPPAAILVVFMVGPLASVTPMCTQPFRIIEMPSHGENL